VVLAGLEGGCQVPMGVWARIEGGALVVEACVLSGDGVEAVRVRREGTPKDAARLTAEVTKALLDGGAGRLLKLVEAPEIAAPVAPNVPAVPSAAALPTVPAGRKTAGKTQKAQSGE
jgi:hypothetical protein